MDQTGCSPASQVAEVTSPATAEFVSLDLGLDNSVRSSKMSLSYQLLLLSQDL